VSVLTVQLSKVSNRSKGKEINIVPNDKKRNREQVNSNFMYVFWWFEG
jgi:hypothetical protein